MKSIQIHDNRSDIGMRECYNDSCITNLPYNTMKEYGIGYMFKTDYGTLIKWADDPTGKGYEDIINKYVNYDHEFTMQQLLRLILKCVDDNDEVSMFNIIKKVKNATIKDWNALKNEVTYLSKYYLSWYNMKEFRKEYGHIGYLEEIYDEDPNAWPIKLPELSDLGDTARFQALRLCCPYCGSSNVQYDIVKGGKFTTDKLSTLSDPIFRNPRIDIYDMGIPEEGIVTIKARNKYGEWVDKEVDITPNPDCELKQARVSPTEIMIAPEEVVQRHMSRHWDYPLERADMINDLYDEKWEYEVQVKDLPEIIQDEIHNSFSMSCTYYDGEPMKELHVYLNGGI